MADIREHVRKSNPDLDLSSWSMTGGYGGQPIVAKFSGGTMITIPEAEYDALAKEHVDARRFEDIADSWSIELPYGGHEWLEPLLPCYVTEKLLTSLYKYRLAFARQSDLEDLLDRISDTGYGNHMEPDVLGFLCDGLVHARQNRCALYACLVD